MAWSLAIPAFALRSASPTAADKALKVEMQVQSVKRLWILLASVVAFLTFIRAIRLLLSLIFRPERPLAESSDSEKASGENVFAGRQLEGNMSYRRLPAALASAFRVILFRIRVPIGPASVASVAELLFIFGYMAAIFTCLLIDTEGGNSWFFEDRAAHIASSQLPLVIALAGKNNVITFFTGIGHEKLNVLHRAAARTCLILLWMHAICRVLAGLSDKFDLSHAWMRWGATALTAFTLSTILSVRPVRNIFFEFFLISHVLLIAIFLVGGYLHARHPGYGDYIWPALVIWVFDRLLRVSRLLWNNRVRRTAGNKSSTATVELLSADTVRLTLRRRFSWKAGQHAYVILPTISELPTEAHPFTIASIPKALDGSDGPEDKDVVFLIRGRNGLTGRLRDHAIEKGTCIVPAYVDGPYGCPPDLTKYSTCILISGGSGVSYTLPLLLDLVHNARANRSSVRRVVFVWSVRDSEHMNWICKLLTEALTAAGSSSLVIDPRVYITGPTCSIPELPPLEYAGSIHKGSDSIAASPISIDEKKMGLPLYWAVKINHGRPSIRRIIQEEISASAGPVSVDVAGPSSLSQSVSDALSTSLTSPQAILRGGASVTLHVETFAMAR